MAAVKAADVPADKSAVPAPSDPPVTPAPAPDASPAPDDATAPSAPKHAAPEPETEGESEVTVVMAITITGTRNEEPWPAIGEQITLPAEEAAGYLKLGYVREVDAE